MSEEKKKHPGGRPQMYTPEQIQEIDKLYDVLNKHLGELLE